MAGGAEARISEELNHSPDTDPRLLNGQQDTIASPDQITPDFVNMSYRKVYNVALTLDRFNDPAGVTVRGTLSITDRATNQVFTLSGFDALDEINTTNDPDGGFESDFWDYFVIGLSGSFDDMDWIIDNFMVEIEGSNAPALDDADFDGHGDVDGADFLTWQRGLGTAGGLTQGNANGDNIINGADLAIWRSQFGPAAVPAANAIPEPSGVLLTLVGLLGVAAFESRRAQGLKS